MSDTRIINVSVEIPEVQTRLIPLYNSAETPIAEVEEDDDADVNAEENDREEARLEAYLDAQEQAREEAEERRFRYLFRT